MTTLFLTACIQPSGATPGKSSDKLFLETRNEQYINAVDYYVKNTNFTNIVLCDNSNYNFSHESWRILRQKAKELDKSLELMSFDGNKKSHIYGYGYGEAEIFDYAFEHSDLLRQSSSRYKITGRYIIKDIDRVIKQTESYECFFQKQGLLMSPFTVSTAFFKISYSIYKQYLYKKQTHLYEILHKKDYKDSYYLKDHFPLERVWYCLLYPYLLSSYKNINSIPLVYLFPKTYTHGVSPLIRNSIYHLYIRLGGSQFGLLHRYIHSIYFQKVYRQAIADDLF